MIERSLALVLTAMCSAIAVLTLGLVAPADPVVGRRLVDRLIEDVCAHPTRAADLGFHCPSEAPP